MSVSRRAEQTPDPTETQPDASGAGSAEQGLTDRIIAKSRTEKDWLVLKEKLLLAYIDAKIHPAYYSRWVKERNQLMKLNIRLHHRLLRLKKKTT